jgi:hypothetical protein
MDPRYPTGKFSFDPAITADKRRAWLGAIQSLPADLRAAIAALPAAKLDTPYRSGGWTARQVVHHIADSHLNAYTRFRLALTEESPTVRPYEESLWAELVDAKSADPELSLTLLDALHARLVMLLDTLTPEQFERPAHHPSNGAISVDWLLQMYAWHGRHHIGHIRLIA